MINEQAYYPSPPLNQFIDVIWLGQADKVNLSSSHHAALFTELIFNYGDTFEVSGQHIESLSHQHDQHIISGLKTTPFETQVSGAYLSIGLILKPFCYHSLINKFDTAEMSELSEVLYQTFVEKRSNRPGVMESHLLKLLNDALPDADLVKFEQYVSRNLVEKGDLAHFNASISLSQKSFIRKFKKHYSLTPGEYVKLRKVNRAIQLIQHQPKCSLTEIGLNVGFYDQSHFSKVFKTFCGTSPKHFFNKSAG